MKNLVCVTMLKEKEEKLCVSFDNNEVRPGKYEIIFFQMTENCEEDDYARENWMGCRVYFFFQRRRTDAMCRNKV